MTTLSQDCFINSKESLFLQEAPVPPPGGGLATDLLKANLTVQGSVTAEQGFKQPVSGSLNSPLLPPGGLITVNTDVGYVSLQLNVPLGIYAVAISNPSWSVSDFIQVSLVNQSCIVTPPNTANTYALLTSLQNVPGLGTTLEVRFVGAYLNAVPVVSFSVIRAS